MYIEEIFKTTRSPQKKEYKRVAFIAPFRLVNGSYQ